VTRTAITLVILFTLPAPLPAATRQAAEKVRQGISHFRAEDYDQAAKAFAEADVSRPDDPWIAFDRACAYAAQGEADKALELFERAAMTRDRKLAVRSRYNLGVMAAEKARALFGEKPQEASPEVRAQGLALLTDAVRHYRDCLDLDEGHADARHNLELIRLWIKHVEELWRQRDRQKEREEKRLLEFLLMIEAQQRALRSGTKSLAGQPDSPLRRQSLATTESSQRTLSEEIEPLKEKIAAELGSAKEQMQSSQTATGSAPDTTLSPEAAEKAVESLTNLADEARDAMVRAANELQDGSPGDAAGLQTEAVDRLDRIYQTVVPFADLVQRAIATEQGIVDQVAPAAEDPDASEQFDFDELAWNQRFVADWVDVLALKAEQGLKGLENLDSSAMVAPPPDGSELADSDAQTKSDAEAMKQQLEGLNQSMEKAVELGPQVRDLAREAAEQLAERNFTQALPKQQEALKLLREVADLLPKQNQQQQQGNQDQDQQGNQKQDQQQSGQEPRQDKRPPQDVSKRQAETILRKVRERQRQRHELDRALQKRIHRPGAVEKDW